MLHVIIVNREAGKKKYKTVVPKMLQKLEEIGEKSIVYYTQKKGHATQIANSLEKRVEKCRIYSVGGDGTLNEIINGINSLKNEVIAIPTGSGNDFIRSVSKTRDPIEIFLESLNKKSNEIDLIKINHKKCINIASMGFDADVVFNTNKYKKIPLISGSVAYIIGIFHTLVVFYDYNLEIIIDGKKIKKDAMLTTFANGIYYGGGLMPAPNALIDDGEIDFVVIEKLSRLKIVKFLGLFKKGEHGSLKEVDFYKCKQIQIKADKVFRLNIDGEIFEDTKLDIEILKHQLNYVVTL